MTSRWLTDIYEETVEGEYCPRSASLGNELPSYCEVSKEMTEVKGMISFEFENMVVECLRKAAQHTEALLRNRWSEWANKPRHSEEIGMFCTSLRSHLSEVNREHKIDDYKTIVGMLSKVNRWDDVLVPKMSEWIYPCLIKFANGVWILNYEKTRELSQMAQTGNRFVDEEAQTYAECKESLLLVERSIPTLNDIANKALLINIESNVVMANLTAIAESLQ